MTNYAGVALQLIVGLVVVFMIYHASSAVVYKDAVVVDYSQRIRTQIFKGWVSTTSFTNRSYNTFNPYSTSFRDLPRSLNNSRGVQFSFSMWTRWNNTSPVNLANKVIFLYGDPNKYTVERTMNGKQKETVTDYVIKCPLLMFSPDGNGMVIQFNTNENISNSIMVDKVKTTDDAGRHNVAAMLPGKWVLWTLVFSGHVNPLESSETGVRVEMYINDFLHHTEVFKGSLRTNKGYIRMLPEPINGGFVADLTYYNWALSQSDVRDVLYQGVTEDMYNEMDTDMSFMQPNYITEYNKLEIYNL